MARDVVVTLPAPGDLLPPDVRERIVRGVAAVGVGIIQQRTGRGVSVEGTSFPPYSPRYARLRAASGRATSPVSLHLSGGMLAGLKVLRSSPDAAVIGFEGSTPREAFARMRTKSGSPSKGRKLKDGSRATHTLKSSTGQLVANAVKARGHNEGTGHLPRRHFFGFSDAERQTLAAEAVRLYRLLARR